MAEAEWNKERAAHELEVQRAQHQRVRDYMLMGVLGLLVIVTILLFFIPAVDNPQQFGQITPETQAWARTFLATIAGSLAGFISGERAGSKS